MKLSAKLLMYILTPTVVIYLLSMSYITINLNNKAIDDAKRLVNSEAYRYANLVKADLDNYVAITRTLSDVFLGYKYIDRHVREPIYLQMQKNILEENPQLISVGTSWEYSAIDTAYTKSYGRILDGWFRGAKGKINYIKRESNMQGDAIGSLYYGLKSSKKETVMDPYFDSYTGEAKDSVLIAGVGIPILENDKFLGLAGVDITLTAFNEMISKIKPFESSYAFLIANNGYFVAFPDKKFLNRPIYDYESDIVRQHNVLVRISKGEQFSLLMEKDEEVFYVSFAPVNIRGIDAPWSLGIVVPLKTILQESNRNLLISLTVGIFGLFFIAFVIWYVSRKITRPLAYSSRVLNRLAKGDIDETRKIRVKTNDEIDAISRSVNTLIDKLKAMAIFASRIGEGDLNAQYERAGKNDVLGNALIDMRRSLQQAVDEDNKRSIEDLKRNWYTEGFATLGQALREDQSNLSQFYYKIVSTVVKHIKANQGGLFIINDVAKDDVYVELVAYFAFNKQKYKSKRLELGEGLVGESIQRNEVLHLTELPENYMEIASGLGKSKPRSLLIVPLRHRDKVYGVIELASFKVMESHQIEFIEKMAESIASTVTHIRSNMRTKLALDEAKQKSDALSKQEAQLQEIIEKMKATQAAGIQREAELSGVLDALNSISLVAEYSMDGKIIDMNNALVKLLGVTREEVLGRYQGSFENRDSRHTEKFKTFWRELKNGKTQRGVAYLRIRGREIWLSEAYTPIYDNEGKPYKVLNITTDITAQRLLDKKQK